MSDTQEKLSRFGHHPDPATDFCIEVEEIQSAHTNINIGFATEQELSTIDERIFKAMRGVYIDPIAANAKHVLRAIEAERRAVRTMDLGASLAVANETIVELLAALKPIADAGRIYQRHNSPNDPDFALWSYRKSFQDEHARIMRSHILNAAEVFDLLETKDKPS